MTVVLSGSQQNEFVNSVQKLLERGTLKRGQTEINRANLLVINVTQ